MAKQTIQKDQHDQHAHLRSLEAGQPVMVKNMLSGDKWIPGVVLKQLGPVSFLVDVGEGKTWRRHLDHLKVRDLPEPVAELAPDVPDNPVMEYGRALEEPGLGAPAPARTANDHSLPVLVPIDPSSPAGTASSSPARTYSPAQTPPAQTPTVPALRRSARPHNMPDYLRY